MIDTVRAVAIKLSEKPVKRHRFQLKPVRCVIAVHTDLIRRWSSYDLTADISCPDIRSLCNMHCFPARLRGSVPQRAREADSEIKNYERAAEKEQRRETGSASKHDYIA